jgi:hypothetical protein
MDPLDGFRDAWVRAAAIRGRRQLAAARLNRFESDALAGVRRDAVGDAIREVRQHRDGDAEKWAGREQGARARDGWRSAGRAEEQSAVRDAAAGALVPCTPDGGQSAAQSFAVRVAEQGEPGQPEPVVWARLPEVQMPEAHSVAQREQQEPARRAQEETQQLMRA